VLRGSQGLGDDHKIWLEGMDENTDQAKWRPLSEFRHYLPERYQNATEGSRRLQAIGVEISLL